MNRTIFQWIVLGLLGGLMLATRLESVVVLTLPFIELVYSLWKNEKFDLPFVYKISPQLVVYGFSVFLAFLPQMIVWKIIFGKYFLNSYSVMHRLVVLEKIKSYGSLPAGEELAAAKSAIGAYLHFLSHPKIHVTLFGSAYGLFTWTPILLLAVVGIYFLIRKNSRIGIM